jgi:hypothetical protein
MKMTQISNTPWGNPDSVEQLADGIFEICTPTHGGIAVRLDKLAQIPAAHRDFARRWSHGFSWDHYGWFEEDCAWSAVALAFPEAFTITQRDTARMIAAHSLPKA